MSCRVLGRRVEDAVLREIVRNAKVRRIHRLVGLYVPTERNSLVKDHYSRLGFDLTETRNDGTTVWELAVEKYASPELPMTVTFSAATEQASGQPTL
jgi:predicted enzyme involved in methoxymalonyl-ACP biosynthesis